MKWIWVIMVISLPFAVLAQEEQTVPLVQPPAVNPMYPSLGMQSYSPWYSPMEQKKMDINVQLGTSFATNFNKGFAFTTYARPELKYRISKKFSIRGGISIANSEYSNTLVYSPYGFSSFSGNVTQGMLYVSGDYMISPKVVLSGTAYKEFSMDRSGNDNFTSPGYDGQGLMMNLRFSPHKNVFIDVGAEFYQGNNPYRSRLYSPFHTSPFMW